MGLESRSRAELNVNGVRQGDEPALTLMLTVRVAVSKTHGLAKAEFAPLRIRMLKIGARIPQTTGRVRIAFAAACRDAATVRHLANALRPGPALRPAPA
jgi:hypothetical protein